MNKTDEALFFTNLKNLKIYKRLKKVTTMLPPPTVYTNRQQHTLDVVNVSNKVEDEIIKLFEKKRVYNLKESCLVHDLGHCCFAHEAEELINDFIASKLCVNKKEVCFSHAVNGALVLAIAAKPKVKRTAFAKMDLYKHHSKDMKMIADSIIKHSFEDYYLGSIYLNYINEEYQHITGKSLLKHTLKDAAPLYNTGYYVIAIDDIASKNSDSVDLMNLYYNSCIYKHSSPYYYRLSDKYINDLKTAITPIYNSFNVKDVFESLDLYQKQKSLLKVTYGFDYKKEFTTKIQAVLREILELVANNPRILKKHFSQKFAYIRRKFIEDINGVGLQKQLNDHNLNIVRSMFYANPYDKTNPYYRIYHRYICTIAYQISNFTDVDLVDFAYYNLSSLTHSTKNCVKWLKQYY